MPNEDKVIETTPEEVFDDKTSEKNEDVLADIPDEEDKPEEGPKEKEKPKSSYEAQKAKYRERALKAEARIEELERRVKDKEQPPQPDDERERAAREFIKRTAREALEEAEHERKSAEDKIVREFEDALEETLEEYPELTENKVLDVIEEFEDEFAGMPSESVLKASVKIIQKREESKKPAMPKASRASEKVEKAPKSVDDSGKSMWEIAQEVIKDLRNR